MSEPSTTTTLRIPTRLYEKVTKMARAARRSVNAQLVTHIENDVESSKKPANKG